MAIPTTISKKKLRVKCVIYQAENNTPLVKYDSAETVIRKLCKLLQVAEAKQVN